MPDKLHRLGDGWAVIYDPARRSGCVEDTRDAKSKPIRFAADRDGAVRLPEGHGIPVPVVDRLKSWVASDSPGFTLPDPD